MARTNLSWFFGSCFATSLLFFASCSDSGPADGGSGSGTNAGTGGGSAGCQSNGSCPGGQTCHPFSGSCVTAGGQCETHDECEGGMYCDGTLGACLPGTTGSPCASSANCEGTCTANVCGCTGLAHEQELASGPLDIYFIFDRTGSMGRDCDYESGQSPSTDSKACFATYALSDYLINVAPMVNTRFAFQFMSQEDDCDGGPYTTPLVDLTALPVDANHALIQAISDENFQGGLGTHIEGALRGLAQYTPAHVTAGREIIGVLMTDGDPRGCEEDIGTLQSIIADHLEATGIRTFIIGMEGATDSNLEQLASAGGAEPHDDWCGDVSAPCHYWNVGDGSGDAIASALQAIVRQSTPLPCDYSVVNLTPPPGETLDYGKVNVTLTENGTTTTIGQVGNQNACPTSQPAWYYDNVSAPTKINLCKNACDLVTNSGTGARVNVVVGCQGTVVVR